MAIKRIFDACLKVIFSVYDFVSHSTLIETIGENRAQAITNKHAIAILAKQIGVSSEYLFGEAIKAAQSEMRQTLEDN